MSDSRLLHAIAELPGRRPSPGELFFPSSGW